MNATFTKAIRYFAETVCLSPLRTGGSENRTELILRDAEQLPFLQGTSLAGAFRSWRNDVELFGSPKQHSSLIISDLQLEDRPQVMRPRLSINGARGTAASGKKFDVAAMPTGTRGSFQITWTGNSDPLVVAEKIEAYLSALNSGEISLGALKANGFGRVSLTVQRRIYDLTDPMDLEAWMQGDDVTGREPVALSEQMERNVLFTVTASVPRILIKAIGNDRSSNGAHSIQMRENNAPIVPGSSLKGTIRSQMARICPYFGYHDPVKALENLFGHENRSKLGGKAGVIRFSDCHLTDTETSRAYRIRINRLTGGVMNHFFEDPLSARVEFEIRIPADRENGCALLLYALRDLGLGLYEVGSGSSVGRGRLESLQVRIQGINAEAMLRCTPQGVELTDNDGLVARWERALRGGKPL